MSPENVLTNFGLLAEASGGVKKLREMILELAVRGMLVEQHPDDEPAEVLLSRITQERQQLMIGRRVGGRGQDQADEATHGSSMPYVIPSNWKWCALADVAGHIVDGTHHTPNYVAEGGIRFISAKDIKNGQIIFDGCRMISRTEHEELSKRCSPRLGDVLVTKSGSIGEVAIVQSEEPFTLFESVALIPLVPSIDKEYAAHVVSLSAAGAFGKKHQKGVAVRHLHLKDLRRLPFPLPPLAEQRRIAARARQLMALCDDLEAKQTRMQEVGSLLTRAALDALTNAEGPEEFAAAWQRVVGNFETILENSGRLEKLRQSILNLAVRGRIARQEPTDEPATKLLEAIAANHEANPKIRRSSRQQEKHNPDGVVRFPLPDSWSWCQIADVVEPSQPISYGVLVPGPDVENGVPFVRIQDLSVRNPPPIPSKRIAPLVEEKYARTKLVGGELLLGVVGSIGKVGIAPKSWRGANIARAVCRIMPHHMVDSAFLAILLQSDFMQGYFKETTRTLAQPTLNVAMIRSAPVPLPPVAEQKRIVAKVNQLMTLCDELETKLQDAEKGAQRLAEAMTAAMVT